MLISASYKTDIPAFYARWLMNRLRAGYCIVRQPYTGGLQRVELTPQAVDGIIFWTKNIGPLLPDLPEIHARGYPFYVQYSINRYPRQLERNVAPFDQVLASALRLAHHFSPRSLVWRYDTMVFTSLTPMSFHIDNFSFIAQALRGATDQVIVSMVQSYRKTAKNLTSACHTYGFSWYEPLMDDKRYLVNQLACIAKQNNMMLHVCSQPELVVSGAVAASCADASRLQSISGSAIRAVRKPKRPHCGCFQANDIGSYDSCPHGCVYCYAVQSYPTARKRYQHHNPEAEMLGE